MLEFQLKSKKKINYFKCCADAVTLLGVVFGVICSTKEQSRTLFHEMSILSGQFWMRTLFRMGIITTLTLVILKPIVKVSQKKLVPIESSKSKLFFILICSVRKLSLNGRKNDF